MSNVNAYIQSAITKWVWSGFYSLQKMQEMIGDLLEEGCDEATLRASVEEKLNEKHIAEKLWPDVTDCDKLDSAFYKLHELGICALSNTGYEMSDGYSYVAEAVSQAPEGHYHGYCFYHGQDVELAVDGEGLMLAFGDLNDRVEESVKVGNTVVTALRAVELNVTWNESFESRIELPTMNWQKRFRA